LKNYFLVIHSPKKFPSYVVVISSIIDVDPPSFEEENAKQIWQDSMVEEYNSIIKSNVWEIVSRLVGESIIDLRWLYKVKHVTNHNIEKSRMSL
jgi:hypothetical protein